MAEQSRVLEHATDRTPMGRHVDAAGTVEPVFSAQCDVAARAFEPGNRSQQRGLAAAAWPEHGRDAVQRQGDGRLEIECAQLRLDVQFEGFRWHGRGTGD